MYWHFDFCHGPFPGEKNVIVVVHYMLAKKNKGSKACPRLGAKSTMESKMIHILNTQAFKSDIHNDVFVNNNPK